MSERKPNAMVKFLESLGIEQDDKEPPNCEFCGAEWPWCDWDFTIRNQPPCQPTRSTPPSTEGDGR